MADTTIPDGEVPEGWTTDPKLLEMTSKGLLGTLAQRAGLEKPVPLMFTTPESGEFYAFLTAGGRYYFTDYLDMSILEILKPKTLDEILQMMRDGRERFIDTKDLKLAEPVETEEEREENERKRKEFAAEEEKLKARLDAGFFDWKAHDQD